MPALPTPLISVSGVRGTVGETFTEDLVRRWTAALAAQVRAVRGERTVILARDTRPSGAWALAIAARTLEEHGVHPIVLGMVPTPTAQLAVTHHRAAGALLITASHNPPEWNGMKFLGPDGVFLSAMEMEQLSHAVIASDATQSPQLRGPEGIASSPPAPRNDVRRTVDGHAIERHIESVLTKLPIDVARVRARQFRIVVDPVNGAGARAVPQLLEALGCGTVVINGEPNGLFAHPPEPTPDHLSELCERVRVERADLGLAVDPDADRLALVDEHGTAISEEYTVTLAALSVLSRRTPVALSGAQQREGSRGNSSAPPQHDAVPAVVVNLSTTRMVEDVARRFGAAVIRTPVGERYVVEGMRAHGAVVGGEGNGGVIVPACHEGRDALVGAALVLDLLARRRVTLSALVGALPRYVMRKEKLPRAGAWSTERTAVALARAFPRASLSTLDGVRVETADGWVHLRPSNTEPSMRLIGEAVSDVALAHLFSTVREAHARVRAL